MYWENINQKKASIALLKGKSIIRNNAKRNNLLDNYSNTDLWEPHHIDSLYKAAIG